MDIGTIAMLLGAGVLGGIMNAIAGGATLVTFPAMLAAGLPPVIANASNSVAVTPGQLVAAYTDRAHLRAVEGTLWLQIAVALAGGTLGAVLLLITPDRVFTKLVPALIGLATLIFALGTRIQAAVARRSHVSGGLARLILVLPATVYGGYFGGGLGVMLLAVLSITGREAIRSANALKNLLSTATSFATIVVFAAQGLVRWPETLVMLSGAAAGGLLGGRLLSVLPAKAVRRIVTAIGIAMTVIYMYRYWL